MDTGPVRLADCARQEKDGVDGNVGSGRRFELTSFVDELRDTLPLRRAPAVHNSVREGQFVAAGLKRPENRSPPSSVEVTEFRFFRVWVAVEYCAAFMPS